ncbi:MAG: DNA primase [bacterium]|nr:DNA primase [bacterium]
MHSFQDVKEQIRRSVDLVDLVSEHVSLRRAGRNLKGLCPFHKEKTPSFNVLPDRQIFKCFGCGVGGDLFKFVQLTENVEFVDALRILADRVGVELAPPRPSAPGETTVGRADLLRVNEWATRWFREQLLGAVGGEARAYLERRGVSAEISERFQIGLAPGSGELQVAARRAGLSQELLTATDLVRAGDHGGVYETFRDRLMFPIRDASNRCIGFGGRTLCDAPAKYLNTASNELFDKGRCLYGLPLARAAITERSEVIVVEGYTDCIACHQHGFAHAVATLGTAATEEHMRALRRYTDSAVLLFDSDAAGQAAAERALAVGLQQNLTVRIAQIPEGGDPADYLQSTGPGEFTELLKSASEALGFMWERTRARFNGPEGGSARRQPVVEFIDLVAELSRFGAVDAIQRGIIIHQVARLLVLPAEEVSALITQRARRLRTGAQRASQPEEAVVQPPALDARQRVLVSMLEVLIGEPGLFGSVAEVFRPAQFADPTYRHIAEVFVEMAGRYGEFDVAELLSALESPTEAQWVTDMVLRSAAYDDPGATLVELHVRWEQFDGVQRGRDAADKVRKPPSGGGQDITEEEVDACLAAVQQSCSQHHFSSAKAAVGGEGIGR